MEPRKNFILIKNPEKKVYGMLDALLEQKSYLLERPGAH